MDRKARLGHSSFTRFGSSGFRLRFSDKAGRFTHLSAYSLEARERRAHINVDFQPSRAGFMLEPDHSRDGPRPQGAAGGALRIG